jgi:hypothetical protein
MLVTEDVGSSGSSNRTSAMTTRPPTTNPATKPGSSPGVFQKLSGDAGACAGEGAVGTTDESS